MNEITLKGVIKDISFSHNIQDVEYYKANLITEPKDGVEYTIPLKFKRFCNKYEDNQKVTIFGNIRSYSQKDENNKGHVHIYVFTYMDDVDDTDKTNYFELDGRICKKDIIKINNQGKCSLSFIIANNIETGENHHLNSYLPCLSFGKIAKDINQLKIGDFISIKGFIRSRQYRKKTSEDNYEIKITHELVVEEFRLNELPV